MRNLLVLAILPVYLLCYYIYQKDREKESKKILTKLFIFGMLSVVPSIFFEVLLGNFFDYRDNSILLVQFVYVFICIALVEELFKWIFVRFISYNDEEFDHIYDMIVYSVFVSLGFAVVENILYVFSSGLLVGIIRALTSIPGHACFAIYMGYYLGISKINMINNYKVKYIKNTFLSLFIPMLIHAIYDFLLLSKKGELAIAFLIFLIVIYISSFKKIKRLSNVSDNFIKK